MDIDVLGIQAKLTAFIETHKLEFEMLRSSQSQLLELGAMVLTSEHYRLCGYKVRANGVQGRQFKIKPTAHGYPWNFSWFEVTRGAQEFHIHSNLPVFSAYGEDEGVYVVDVGVVRPGAVPLGKDPAEKWRAVANQDLETFVEAKKLVIYPMLMAQFIGIVHEIQPQFLDERCTIRFALAQHFTPALVSVGKLDGTAAGIRRGFRRRGYRITVVPHFDLEIAHLRWGRLSVSPFLAREFPHNMKLKWWKTKVRVALSRAVVPGQSWVHASQEASATSPTLSRKCNRTPGARSRLAFARATR